MHIYYKISTYRFEIAMNDVFLEQQPQALDDRNGKATDQAQTEAVIIVLFDELVQVDTVIRINAIQSAIKIRFNVMFQTNLSIL